tara:strand:- start:53 stop:547 length:495 start_codon:yes stop_codon:yes gene_type:complete
MNLNKRGQEEMIGFIVIVVLVIIIGVVFLGISLRQTPQGFEQESQDINQFLEASMRFTSSCTLQMPEYLDLGNLIQECNKNSLCLSGESACEVLESTFSSLIDSSYNVGENSPIKGTSFKITQNSEIPLELILIENGNCNNSSRARFGEVIAPNKISSSLKLCF